MAASYTTSRRAVFRPGHSWMRGMVRATNARSVKETGSQRVASVGPLSPAVRPGTVRRSRELLPYLLSLSLFSVSVKAL